MFMVKSYQESDEKKSFNYYISAFLAFIVENF